MTEQEQRNKIVQIARKYIGVPYGAGGYAPPGQTPKCFDCAGLLLRVGVEAGCCEPGASLTPFGRVPKPRDFEQMWQWCDQIPMAEAREGDVLIFASPEALTRPWHLGLKSDIGVIWVNPLRSIMAVTEHTMQPDLTRLIIGAARFRCP